MQKARNRQSNALWTAPATLALCVACSGIFVSPAQAADAAASPALHPPEGLVVKSDARRAVGGLAALVVVGLLDENLAREGTESNSPFAISTAQVGERMGNPIYLAPAMGAVWLGGKMSGHPGLSTSTLRIAGGIAASVVVSTGLKMTVGRARPNDAPDDPDEFRPFSGQSAFPSGHTTVAFSLASGIDRETKAHWVPFVVYPMAGLVGWSRIRDNRHWASDVLAGAIVGVWASHKFAVLTGPGHDGPSPLVEMGVGPNPTGPGGAASATLHF